jgi:hypothetical protein
MSDRTCLIIGKRPQENANVNVNVVFGGTDQYPHAKDEGTVASVASASISLKDDVYHQKLSITHCL